MISRPKLSMDCCSILKAIQFLGVMAERAYFFELYFALSWT